jgi:hypothetical protein
MAIVIGVTVGLAVDYLIRRYRRKRAPALAAAREGGGVVPAAKGDNKKPSATMVPLLSRRSLICLAIGLAIGAGLGLGYWAISPLNAEVEAAWPFIELADNQPNLYRSTVYIQVMNPGTSVVRVETLRRDIQYYAAKMNTSPFFEFLSENIAKQAPQYFHTANDLAKAILIDLRYQDTTADIRVRVTSQTPEEALFLASVTGQLFQEYLITEDLNIEKEAYQSQLNDIETTKTDLLEAQRKLWQIVGQGQGYDLATDPQYIALNARVEALQRELIAAADRMAVLITQGDSSDNYTKARDAVERASEALGEARQEVTRLKAQAAVSYFEQMAAYTEASATVERLSKQLNDLIAGLALPSPNVPELTQSSYFLSVGEPSIPVPILPEKIRGRNALMIGALLGLGVAWVGLNRRWLVKQVSSPREESEESTT